MGASTTRRNATRHARGNSAACAASKQASIDFFLLLCFVGFGQQGKKKEGSLSCCCCNGFNDGLGHAPVCSRGAGILFLLVLGCLSQLSALVGWHSDLCSRRRCRLSACRLFNRSNQSKATTPVRSLPSRIRHTPAHNSHASSSSSSSSTPRPPRGGAGRRRHRHPRHPWHAIIDTCLPPAAPQGHRAPGGRRAAAGGAAGGWGQRQWGARLGAGAGCRVSRRLIDRSID